ncbi:MAG: hypothetical protein JSW28_02115 [Thermoplasmata archaeon]|nr:MAG: hypothetical protein JSW28_02115 [Thermoplasmata archaeon]
MDFVAWGISPNGIDYTNASELGEWISGENVQPSTEPGMTLGRDKDGTDTDTVADWENSGGIHSLGPTKNARNAETEPPVIVDVSDVPSPQDYLAEVNIYANITENLGFTDVRLNYSFDGVIWYQITMDFVAGNATNATYMGIIPPADIETTVQYAVYVADNATNEAVSSVMIYTTEILHEVFLYYGWNLISLSFIQSDTDLDSVLLPISGFYDAVRWYNATDSNDHWKHNHTAKPSHLNDLEDIDHTMGFWIQVTEPGGVLFEYPGTKPNVSQQITLHPGWNQVGYPSPRGFNRTA